MSGSRTTNTLRNMAGGIVNRAVRLLFPFAVRTLLLYRLGVEYLGLSSLFSSMLNVLSVAELGFSSAIVFSLYEPMAKGKKDEICALLALYRRIYRIVGMVILAAGLMLMPFLKRLISSSLPSGINIYILYLIHLSSTVISYLTFSYKNALFAADQRQDIMSNVDSIANAGKYILQLVLLAAVPNYYVYAVWLPISTLASNVITQIVSRRKYPDYFCRGQVKPKVMAGIFRQVRGLALGKFGYVSRNAFDSVIISSFLGLTAVGIYSNYMYVFNAVTTVLSVIINAVTSAVGNSIAIDTKEKNLRDFEKFNYIYSVFSGMCTVCMLCLYQPFMAMWAGESLMLPKHTMVLFCCYFYINQLGQIRGVYSAGAGIWWEMRYLTAAEMAANLLLNVLLGRLLGIDGVILATVITVFLSSFIGLSVVTFRVYFNSPVSKYFTDSAKHTATAVVACAASYGCCGLVSCDGLIGLLLRAAVCVAVGAAIFGGSALIDRQNREYLFSMRFMIKLAVFRKRKS